MAGKPSGSSKIRVKMSKITFPEICPVCLDEPADLVFVTVLERYGHDYSASSWVKQNDKTSVALETAKGAVTFTIPTCMLHGSKSVRTVKTKIIAAVGFFVLFYPMLFYLLQINAALTSSRPVLGPLLGFLVMTGLFLILLLYGLFPRALERAVQFHYVNRAKDVVFLSIRNDEYRAKFLDLNEMSAAVLDEDKEKSETPEKTEEGA